MGHQKYFFTWESLSGKKYVEMLYDTWIEWFGEGKKSYTGASNIWRALTSSFDILSYWLVWKPGNGEDIRIGVDPLIRSHTYYKIFENLISILKGKGIKFMAQEGTCNMENTCHTRWKNDDLLGLHWVLKE
jgi:hypothetical protein